MTPERLATLKIRVVHPLREPEIRRELIEEIERLQEEVARYKPFYEEAFHRAALLGEL